MQELEKILEEIEKQKSCCLMIGYAKEYNQGALKMAEVIEDIIRKHMDNNNLCEKCSRRKWYQIGYKDGKNDGWIPVEKRLPKAPEMEDEYPEFNVMIEGAKTPTTLQYTQEGIWVDDYGNAYNVIAWQPLPEPYIPKTQNKPEDHYPEWRAKFLNKFDRRL